MIIVHVEDYFDPTAGYQINELLKMSSKFSDDVTLITSNDMSPFHKKVNLGDDELFQSMYRVKIIRLKCIFKISSRLILDKLSRNIRELNPDIVFMHGIGDFKDLMLFRKKRNYCVIRDCHMSWVASKNIFRKVFYTIFKILFSNIINSTGKYLFVYALGDEEYDYLLNIGVSKGKIRFLRHGYSSEDMYYDEVARNEIREGYGIKNGEIVISYIGKFDHSKKPDLILDIVDALHQEYILNYKLKLLFIGPKNSKYMSYFDSKVENQSNHIDITIDSSKDFSVLRKYYSASDICIFPKETSLSSLHAQVCRCVTIMEDHKSNRERVINSENLFQPNDLLAAVGIIIRVVDNKEYLKSANAMNSIFLSNRDYINQYKQLLKDIDEMIVANQ